MGLMVIWPGCQVEVQETLQVKAHIRQGAVEGPRTEKSRFPYRHAPNSRAW